jgi:transcriptional regulator with XRE-family HTH domain
MTVPTVPPFPIRPPSGYAELRPHVERRYSAGIIQGALAGVANWSPSYVSELERGCRPVSPAALARYVDALSAIEARIEAIRARLDELPPPARPMTPADLRTALSGSPDRLPVPWGRGEGAGHE